MVSFLQVATTVPFDRKLANDYTNSIQFPVFLISMAYVVTIFSIKKIMENRKPYQERDKFLVSFLSNIGTIEIRKKTDCPQGPCLLMGHLLNLTGALNFWNAWLAIFSTLGAIVCGYGLLHEIYTRGLVSSYTHCGEFFTGASGLFAWVFVMSKVAEFGDTILIVLRKKPLIFLHWYHHVLTMNYAFLTYPLPNAFNSWITWMNFFVHSIMYGYFMLRSFGVRVPAWVAQNITSLQILQFLITHLILFHVGYLQFIVGQNVDSVSWAFWFCLTMEISYVYLFGQFFYVSYVKAGGKKYKAEEKPKSQ